jgi:DNA-binding transcriptional ArsR family regulator
MSRVNIDPFSALADVHRREMLMLLSKNKLSINALAENFDISRPAVSKHIKVLHEAGLISITDRGRERYCELHEEGFSEVKEWLNYFDKFWKSKLQSLEDLLNQQARQERS